MAQGPARKFRLPLIAAILALGACASNPPAPVEDRSSGDARPPDAAEAPPPARVDERHVVERGDTLYAIAFKRGVDFRDLAAWNGIMPPYRIFVGQQLRLNAPNGAPARPVSSAGTAAAPDRVVAVTAPAPAAVPQNPPVEKSTKPQPSMFEDVSPAPATAAATAEPAVKPAAAKPVQAPPVAAKPVATEPEAAPAAAPAPPPIAASKPAEKPVDKPAERVAELNAGGVNWRWPGDGKVVGTFVAGDQIRQGIDIAGKAGDAVRAAAEGEVVYSGNGLLGYGELIIIKHNANFLSAYGHNRQRLVKEGDRVKAGQQIAELGSSASAREELHFEIRKNGKPVNPLDYLPVR